MEIYFEESFEKDLRSIDNKKQLNKVKEIIDEIKNAKTLKEIRSLEKLKGYETYYRIRTGDFRVGIEFVEGKVILTRFLHRKDIYKYFP